MYVTPPNDYIQSETILKELLTNYGAIAGIRFDGIGEYYRHPNDFLEVGNLYAYIKQLQPQCLVSFKTGFTGDERECIYKEKKKRPVLRLKGNNLEYKMQRFKTVWDEELSKKPIELCATLLKKEQWFNVKDGIHKTKNEVLEEFLYTQRHCVNYLLNIGLRGDGSVHPLDYSVLNGLIDEIHFDKVEK